MNNPTRITIELKTNGIPNIKALLKALEFKAHDYLMAKGVLVTQATAMLEPSDDDLIGLSVSPNLPVNLEINND